MIKQIKQEKEKLRVEEIEYILSLVEFKAYECVIYSTEQMEFLENIIKKLHKQKEAFKQKE